MNYVHLYIYVYRYVTIIIWSDNLWKTFDKHKHLMNMKSIITGWWSHATQQGSAINVNVWKNWPTYILTIWWSGVSDNVTAVKPQIYGIKEEMVSIFHVLINRTIKIDVGNNGDDHRKKLETKKHAQPKHRLPEMSNFGQSRHLKVGKSVGDVNYKD